MMDCGKITGNSRTYRVYRLLSDISYLLVFHLSILNAGDKDIARSVRGEFLGLYSLF
jgi:hypothetical protein